MSSVHSVSALASASGSHGSGSLRCRDCASAGSPAQKDPVRRFIGTQVSPMGVWAWRCPEARSAASTRMLGFPVSPAALPVSPGSALSTLLCGSRRFCLVSSGSLVLGVGFLGSRRFCEFGLCFVRGCSMDSRKFCEFWSGFVQSLLSGLQKVLRVLLRFVSEFARWTPEGSLTPKRYLPGQAPCPWGRAVGRLSGGLGSRARVDVG